MGPWRAVPLVLLLGLVFRSAFAFATGSGQEAGFSPLFNGKNLDGWEAPPGENGPWQVTDGVIDCDVRRRAASNGRHGDQSLWTTRSYGDFVLKLEWRLKEAPYPNSVPDILPDGTHRRGPDGKEVRIAIQDCDSGVYLRGSSKSQV